MKHWTVKVSEKILFGFPTVHKAAEFAEMLKYVVLASPCYSNGEIRWMQESPGRICIEEIDVQMFPVEPEEERLDNEPED